MIINHNLNAMNAHRNMGINTGNAAKSMEKLSSGLRINRAGDDAAGLSISEKMRAQIRGLDQASRNAQDGISLIQTAEGSLNETHSILQRMRELAVQASNDTNVTVDRSAITDELTSLQTEVDRIAKTTQFNEKNLLDGSLSGGGVSGAVLQIGANNSSDLSLEIKIDKMDAASLGITTASINVTSNTFAKATIDNVNSAIKAVSTQRSKLGAYQNRLEHTINNLDNASENLQAAESRVRDVDMAKEMMEYSKNNILQQAAQSMLSQANQAPQGVLNLLR
ncbi:flagellin [Clostridium beijerinckii]|uniref:flagellin N-terminal helical domain-containing protein n=1 Tax=Clostridium beijerinckii TaxID=1520 RepID=UPI00098CD8E8|nr:flagellin [Clostridium beijerinckii]MBA8933027.1 flagellin [Clostridium beijerinckii]NRT79376.1 flagellin [Clostridium beijerinckii]NRU37230.1 flagellin [Clostridium beijerinckii]NSA99491.1 flagellin [Clostridium beijerinckii]OOM49110.1 flagellin [Clostridium beijerinckii]